MRSDPFIPLTRIGAILVCTGVLVTGGCSSQGFLPDEPDHATSSPAPATDTTVWVPPTPSPSQTPTSGLIPPADPIEEDEPGWDCATMGNQDCGTPATPPVTIPKPQAPKMAPAAPQQPVPAPVVPVPAPQPVDTPPAQHIPHEDEFGPDPAQLCPDGRSECPTGEVVPVPVVEPTSPITPEGD